MPGLGKKTFTAGDVLIAGDVNNYLMDQTVMNFATVAARSSAIPVPSTGMVSYVGDTGSESATNATIANVPQIQAYTGSAWQNVDGLTLVAKATIGSGVSSITMTNVFTTSYENYKVFITGGTGSAGEIYLRLALDSVNTGYFSSLIFTGMVSGSLGSLGGNNTAFFPYVGFANTTSAHANIDLTSVSTTEQTRMFAPFIDNANAGTHTGVSTNTNAHTSFTITTLGGSLTGGTIYVYGYRSA
jgi:hypothetical protein